METLAFKEGGAWDTVRQDWWLALIFFFDRAFYQGRSDILSSRFERATIKALNRVFSAPSSDEKLSLLKEARYWLDREQWKRPKNPFWDVLCKGYDIGEIKRYGTGRERDREMVLDSLRFIVNDCKDSNILEHSIHCIKSANIGDLSRELHSIVGIGDKIASFFLRDTVFFYDLEACVKAEDYHYLVPIDVWVSKVTDKLGMKTDAEAIATTCLQNGISPVRFAIGLWYVGFHSLDVLLDML